MSLSFFAELKRRNVFRVAVAYVVMTWLVLQVADVILNNIEAPGWVFQAIMLVLAVGFPVVVAFAWIFELTPEGIKREKDVDRSQSITSETGQKLNRAIIVTLVLAVGYFFWESRYAGDAPADEQASQASIAVLPFVNMSPDADQEYFSDGISEEILNVLAQIPNLHVTSRSSAFQFKGENVDIPTVAARLGVDHVLEGSVRKAGNRVRITAQLIEAGSDSHLWSETYDRELTDVFAVQDEISTAIVDALQEALGIEVSAPSRENEVIIDQEAYNAYLQGVYQMELRGAEPLARAAEHLERALEIQPEYVAAMARLAMVYSLLPKYDESLSLRDYVDRSRPLAERAYELDPDSWEANLAMAGMTWDFAVREGSRLTEARAYARRAIELNPSYGTSYAWLAGMTRADGDLAEAFRISEAAVEIDPLNRIILDNLAGEYIRRQRYENARRTIDRLKTVAPEAAYSRAAQLATSQGRWADNAIALLQSFALAPEDSNYWARRIVADDLGLPREALTIGERDSYCDLYMLYLDDLERTLECHGEAMPDLPDGAQDFMAGALAVYEGRVEEGFERMDGAWQDFERSDTTFPGPVYLHAAVESGHEERARELLEDLVDVVGSRREAGDISAVYDRAEGYAYYILGEKERALPFLQQTARDGLYIRWEWFYYDRFRDDPEVQRLIESQQAKTESERKRFLTIMCGPDNPVADFWTPSDDACAMLGETQDYGAG